MNWMAVFLYLWAAGVSGALAAVPPKDFGRRFFRFNVAIVLAFVTIATAVAQPFFDGAPIGSLRFLGHLLAWILAADAVAVSLLVFSRTRPVLSVAFLLPVITGALFATAVAFAAASGTPGTAAILTLHLLTSGALLGTVLVAMNLGHAYLQNAALSFDPLVRMARLFLGAAIAKAVVSFVLFAPQAARWWPELLDTFDGMLILVRIGAGLGVAVALGAMVLACARSRANQSATGILYASVVFVLVGEAISMYLTLDRGIRV